jgi:MoaA/NifB/PqqE/SkfB family radical SAM enzyme
MKLKPDSYAQVDDEGRLIIPSNIAARYGLKPGAVAPLVEAEQAIVLRQPPTHLKKVYIEPTNRCNLDCRMCIRRTWDEPLGKMDANVFKRIIEGLRDFSFTPSIIFGGFGEPLSHPDIVEMVTEAKRLKASVELITNAILLDAKIAKQLTTAQLDVLWISLEGAKTESYADVRLGGELSDVLYNVRQFRDSRQAYHTEIGIVLVAMKRNIKELPAVMRLARELGASRFLVTNVLPYTEELSSEVLYSCELRDDKNPFRSLNSTFELCKMDINDLTINPLQSIIRNASIINDTAANTGAMQNYCPFIEGGSVAISWDGNVSPCLPLLHSHTSFLGERKRHTRGFSVGNVADQSLKDIWDSSTCITFRRRVQAFIFASCTACKGCDLAEMNDVDCLGNGFPSCGGCLWAQGYIRCP